MKKIPDVIELSSHPETDRPLTAKELAEAEIVSKKEAGITQEFLTEVAAMRKAAKRGRPKSPSPKKLLSFRLSGDIVEHLTQEVPSYNVRVEQILREAMTEGRL